MVLRGRDGRYLAFGATAGDRWLLAVYVLRPRGEVRVITARDMTVTERRWYRTQRKGRS